MGIAKITRNYQVTLPRDIRKVISVREGDEIMFIVEDDRVLLTKSKEDPVISAAGVWKNIKETGAEYQKRARGQWKKRQRRVNW